MDFPFSISHTVSAYLQSSSIALSMRVVLEITMGLAIPRRLQLDMDTLDRDGGQREGASSCALS